MTSIGAYKIQTMNFGETNLTKIYRLQFGSTTNAAPRNPPPSPVVVGAGQDAGKDNEVEVNKFTTCPQCGNNAHYTCGNKNCSCWRSIPSGEKPLIYRPMLNGIILPVKIFNFLYKRFYKIWGIWLHEALECPYCGFVGSFDYWEERDMDKNWPTKP